MSRLFEKQITIGGKAIYRDIEVGKKREQLLKDALAGRITQQEMREQAKKTKYLYSVLPDNGKVV